MNPATYLLPQAICTGICYSLLTSLAATVSLKILLLLFRNVRSFYKYHLCNAALLAGFTGFAAPFIRLAQTPQHIITGKQILTAVNTSPVQQVITTQPQPALVSLSENTWQLITHKLATWSTGICALCIAGLLLFSIKFLWD